ncbi:MAG TPA: molecular chaperone HtpG [Acidimicrobiaceae bacterium]|nr:molecular chaperone HtpG [Acidimicrobiaceae bacterium]
MRRMSTTRDTSVDLNGLLTVLGEHLYSTPKVAVRELVQNAHDSITRRIIEGGPVEGPRIDVEADADAGTITISDNGAGLTEAEIHSYLATIGAGYTRLLRGRSDDLIGQFGLGFLSAFVISDEVVVTTTSFRTPHERWEYRSRGGLNYDVRSVPPAGECTTVVLHVKPLHRTLLDDQQLERTLRRYCVLLEHPVHMDGQRINVSPPWRRQLSDPTEQAAAELQFAADFDPVFQPLCTLPVVASGNSDARGLLWVHDGSTYGNSDNRSMSVFVRGMLLDDDATDLLPRWAGFVGGVVESTRLVPTASREDLQRNDAYLATQAALSEALVTGLAQLAAERPEVWRRITRRHSEAMLGAALVDDRLFDVIAPNVVVPTAGGELRPDELVRDGRVHLTYEATGGFREMLFAALQVPLALGFRYGVSGFLHKWCQARGITLVEVGTAEGDDALFQPAELDDSATAWLQRNLADEGEEVVLARFAPASLPLVRVVDQKAELRKRLDDDEADARISAMALAMARLYTDRLKDRAAARVYVNLDNPALAAVVAAHMMENPRAEEGAMVLRALKNVISATGLLLPSLDVLNAVVERAVEDNG